MAQTYSLLGRGEVEREKKKNKKKKKIGKH